jgi:putative nucleotidyltransferase with HDIG domain
VESLANFFVVPTIEQDYIATTRDKQLASASVSSVSIEVKQGTALIRQGNQVTEEQMRTLVALRQQRESRLGEVAGRAILVFAILWILCGYLQRYNRDLLEDIPRLAALLGQIAFVVWTGFLVSWGVEALEGVNSPVGYLVPVAAVGILVTLLESSRLGIFSVLLTTVLVGLQTYWDFTILVVLALTGIIAVYHATGASIRSQIYLAWPWIVVPGIVMSTGVHLVANPSWQAFTSTLTPFFWGWFWLALNGFLSVGISLLLLPLLEDVLGVTTEFKLRELSVSHPLLRRLEEVAPGTYYHSLNVSVLAEAAAAAIGANALLVKVAAYYHDIGKVEKPAYFGENQFTEEDKKKHSKISPHMSCLIIRNHVKIGLEMAREYKLPEAILPFIAEHHGTTLISYFYDTARAEDPHGTVTEGDFRYTGPKPQTIEEAVMMLADTIEAASRSMKLVGEGEIRVFVKRMINDKMIDGQFDECPLTFKELRILSESFTRTLRSMMHRRIAYPSTPEVELHPKSGQEQNVQPLFGGS